MERDLYTFYSLSATCFMEIKRFLVAVDKYYMSEQLYNQYPLIFRREEGDFLDEEHKNYCEMFDLHVFIYGFVIEIYKKYTELRAQDILSLFGFSFGENKELYDSVLFDYSKMFKMFIPDIKHCLQLDISQISSFSDDFKYVLGNYFEMGTFGMNNFKEDLVSLALMLYEKPLMSIQTRILLEIKLLNHYSEKSIYKIEIFERLVQDNIKLVEQLKKNGTIDYSHVGHCMDIVNFVRDNYEHFIVNDVAILLWCMLWNVKYFTEDLETLFFNSVVHKICDNIFECISKMVQDEYPILNTFMTSYLFRYIMDLLNISYNDHCNIYVSDIPIILEYMVLSEKPLNLIASIIDKENDLEKIKDYIDEDDLENVKNAIEKIDKLVEKDTEGKFVDMITSTYIIDPFPLKNGEETIFLDKNQVMINSLENGINPFTREKMSVYDVILLSNSLTEEIQNFKKQQIEYEKNNIIQ